MRMSKPEKKGLVPERRFPEFRGKGEWEAKRLEDFSVIVRGGSPRPIDEYITNNSDGLNWLKIGDIDKESKYVTSTQEKVIPAALAKTRVVNPGDLILSNSMSFGRPYILEIRTCIHDGWIAVSELDKNLDRDYLYYLMMTSASQTYFSNNAAGSGVQNLNADIIKLLPVSYPSKNEQQKIADCLTSIDELITAQTQQLAALKTHKKGLMQRLLPAEGETVPKLRFPEFLDKGEWEQRLIEDFFFVGSSKRVLQQDWTTQGVPFYRTRELVSLSKNEPFGSEIFISEELFCEISEKYGLPTAGDFLVSGVGTLGISYQVQAQDRFYFKDGNVLWFKLKGGIVSTFFKYCFEADEIQDQILSQASISTVGTYTIQNAKATKFSCPPNIEEQQKIADCLSSVDELITAQTQKLDALKAHKKGLMQQLFPAMDEVSA